MGYKNIKPELIYLDDLVLKCGLFTSDTDLNNGYGCKSKSKIKDEPGKCYGFDCPLASEASLADLKKHDEYLYNEHKQNFNHNQLKDEDNCFPDDYGSSWLIQYRSLSK